MTALCIALIDDHAIFRIGLGMVITTAIPGTRVFEAQSVIEALDSAAPERVDVVLLDIRLHGMSGLEGIALVKHKWPTAPVLMLSSHDEPETVRLALARGASGFVSKAAAATKIVEAIQRVVRDKFPGLPLNGVAPMRHLTPRQCEVLELLHQGLSNKLIARQLSLSDNTVRRHVQDILEFFGVASRTEAVFAARCQALVG